MSVHGAQLFRWNFFDQLTIGIKLITLNPQFIALRWMVGEICDDKVDDKKSLALCRYFKCKLDRSDRILYRRTAAGFFEDGGDGFDFDIERVESAGSHLAAKNPRGFFPGKLSQVNRIGRGGYFLPSGLPEFESGSRAEQNFVYDNFNLAEVTDCFPVVLDLKLQHSALAFGAEHGHRIQA